MSHDTHAAHQTEHTDSRPGSSFTSAIWFTILMAFLFIAAANFVKVMSHDDGGHDTGHAAPAHDDHGASGHNEGDGHGH